jgi:hypothetical protein
VKTRIIYVMALFVLAGCNTTEKQHSADTDTTTEHHAHNHATHGGDPRVAEVMAIHDSIMPSMSTIMGLKQAITSDLKTTDSLLTIKSTDDLKKRKEEAFALHIQLDKADKEMMNWMHQYKADTLDKLGEEKAAAYIADQKQKIVEVRDQMNRSIQDARAFIDKY